MDAKSKADFINSVGNEQEVICQGCGAKNKASSKFCMSCGKEIKPAVKTSDSEPAFAPAAEVVLKAPVKEEEKIVNIPEQEKYIEPQSVFAQGLPSWNIEPPQVVVRRR